MRQETKHPTAETWAAGRHSATGPSTVGPTTTPLGISVTVTYKKRRLFVNKLHYMTTQGHTLLAARAAQSA